MGSIALPCGWLVGSKRRARGLAPWRQARSLNEARDSSKNAQVFENNNMNAASVTVSNWRAFGISMLVDTLGIGNTCVKCAGARWQRETRP